MKVEICKCGNGDVIKLNNQWIYVTALMAGTIQGRPLNYCPSCGIKLESE